MCSSSDFSHFQVFGQINPISFKIMVFAKCPLKQDLPTTGNQTFYTETKKKLSLPAKNTVSNLVLEGQCKLCFQNSLQNRTLHQPLPILPLGFGGSPP